MMSATSPDPSVPSTREAGASPCPPFRERLARCGASPLRRSSRVETVQVNLGKLCNQACQHCHVDAGPNRSERMSRATAARVVERLRASRHVTTLDLTGGAPELNDNFRDLVAAGRELGLRVIDRCNLTVLLEPGMEWLAGFLAANRVDVVCSLPCYTADNVDRQRGRGVFEKSIEALRLLNRLGYGRTEGTLRLDLVYNPLGPWLPPPQAELEQTYRQELRERFGIEFDRLLTITNMPIQRFASQLLREGKYEEYMRLLAGHFNAKTLESLMCRSMVSVAWDGRLYDCDFNQMLGLQPPAAAAHLDDIASFDELAGTEIAIGQHCYGCTAGAGSSCSGALA